MPLPTCSTLALSSLEAPDKGRHDYAEWLHIRILRELPACGKHALPDCPDAFALYHKHGFYVPIFQFAQSTWMRITCTVYNEMSDIKVVGQAVLQEMMGTATATAVEAGNGVADRQHRW